MSFIELQRETKANAVQRFIEKRDKKGIPFEITGKFMQSGGTQYVSDVIIGRRTDLVILPRVIGGIPIPFPSKKELATLNLEKLQKS